MNGRQHLFFGYSVALLIALGTLCPAPADTVLLSPRSDIKDPATATRSKSEASVFWGLAQRAREGTDGLRELQAHARNPSGFFESAFMVSLDTQGALVESLCRGRSPADLRLAAAALCLRALGDHMEQVRQDERIAVVHRDATGQEIPLGNRAGRGRKARNAGVAAQEPPAAPGAPLPHIAALIGADDPPTVFFALQAAAYARDATPAAAIRSLRVATPQVAAARFFYQAMLGEKPDAGAVKAVLAAVTRPQTSRDATAAPSTGPSFDVNVPPLCLACQALAELADEAYAPFLNQALANDDVRVQIEAARAIRRIGGKASLPALAKVLPTCSWPVAIEVCAAAAAIPDERMVPHLVQRLKREKGRLRQDLVHALSCIAGEQKAEDAAGWAAWWTANGAAFKVDPAASEQYRSSKRVQDTVVLGNGRFYTLPIYSDRFCYVLDSSNSMKGPRIASLKQNMAESIGGLGNEVMFNIVDFGGDVEILYDRALTDSKRLGLARVAEMDQSGGTRCFCAIRQAARLREVDAIYLLSDGAPVRDSMADWNEIIRAYMVMTRYRQIAMFCIDFDPRPGNQAAMIRFADFHCGLHESIEI